MVAGGGTVRSFEVDPDRVWAALLAVIGRHTWRVSRRDGAAMSLTVRSLPSFASWGQKASVVVRPTTNGCDVLASASAVMPTEIRGSHRANALVDTILAEVDRELLRDR